MDTDKIRQHIDSAYRLISTIYVRDSAVKVMAMAMQHLEEASAVLQDEHKEDKEDKDGR
nr:MAG TPA: Pre-mRNA-splicing factor 8, Pre-mRNA-splicing factor-mRNA splicing, spliceosome, post-catalytic, P [Bacteriophage sp.]